MDRAQLTELILQSLEHERGGVLVYETAVKAAVDDDLREEWHRYLEQTKRHVQILEGVCRTLEIDSEQQSPGRKIVRDLGRSLVNAMQTAQQAGDAIAAQLVAAECVVLAETKDHADWELIGKCVAGLEGDEQAALSAAYEEVEDQEDEHLYHTRGWARELWLESLGLPAVLPPPEERKHVKTAIGAALAEQDSMANRQ
jgi:rubrerythrin